jgi:hypothetical protein
VLLFLLVHFYNPLHLPLLHSHHLLHSHYFYNPLHVPLFHSHHIPGISVSMQRIQIIVENAECF